MKAEEIEEYVKLDNLLKVIYIFECRHSENSLKQIENWRCVFLLFSSVVFNNFILRMCDMENGSVDKNVETISCSQKSHLKTHRT